MPSEVQNPSDFLLYNLGTYKKSVIFTPVYLTKPPYHHFHLWVPEPAGCLREKRYPSPPRDHRPPLTYEPVKRASMSDGILHSISNYLRPLLQLTSASTSRLRMASSFSSARQVRTPSKYWERCWSALVTVISRLLYVFSAARFFQNKNTFKKNVQFNIANIYLCSSYL